MSMMDFLNVGSALVAQDVARRSMRGSSSEFLFGLPGPKPRELVSFSTFESGAPGSAPTTAGVAAPVAAVAPDNGDAAAGVRVLEDSTAARSLGSVDPEYPPRGAAARKHGAGHAAAAALGGVAPSSASAPAAAPPPPPLVAAPAPPPSESAAAKGGAADAGDGSSGQEPGGHAELTTSGGGTAPGAQAGGQVDASAAGGELHHHHSPTATSSNSGFADHLYNTMTTVRAHAVEDPAKVPSLFSAGDFLVQPVESHSHAGSSVAGLHAPFHMVPVYSVARARDETLQDIATGVKALKTTLMIAGGLANKLFGLSMMGFLVFQSMKSTAATKPEPPKRPELVPSPKRAPAPGSRAPQARSCGVKKGNGAAEGAVAKTAGTGEGPTGGILDD